MEHIRVALVLLLSAPLVGCAANADDEPQPTVTATERVTASPSMSPTPSSTPTATPQEEPPVQAAPGDVATQVREAAGDEVTAAEEAAPGEYVVTTSLVDPRADAGSVAGLAAVSICEAVQEALGATNVRVEESDGTTFAVLGGAYTVCTEV